MIKNIKLKTPIIYRWWFKLLLAFIMITPLITEMPYKAQDTFAIIASVLKNPAIGSAGWLLPLAKILLIFMAFLPFIIKINSEKIVLFYYAFMLVCTGIFQNLSTTTVVPTVVGMTFITGNAILQLTACGFCLLDAVKHKSKFQISELDKSKLWIVPFMLMAVLMPYTLQNSVFKPGVSSILTNEAGVTYCMITPCIIGIFILFHRSCYKPTLNAISFIGTLFGMSSMATWFFFDSENWWLGVIRIPLLVISVYGLFLSRKKVFCKGC